ncbi:RNA methyltransferase [bacterium]|nr:RNA methyltransferase [bacterium]
MITSSSNPLIKKVRALFKRGYDPGSRVFITEGKKLVGDIIKAFPEIVNQVVFSNSFTEKNPDFHQIVPKKAEQEIFESNLYKRISPLKNPEGVLCICSIPKSSEIEDMGEKVLLLYDVQIPENMGGILRIAEVFGFKSIFYTKSSAYPYSSKVFRASQAAPVYLNMKRLPQDEVITTLKAMKSEGYRLICADVKGDESILHDGIITKKGKSLLIIGNEGNGLPDELISECDLNIRIRQQGNIESLNVASAAAILMHYFS